MFWMMMYFLLFGGGGGSDGLHIPDAKVFSKAVKDPVRREVVLDLREQAERHEDQWNASRQQAFQDLAALNPRHDLTPEALEAVLTELNEARTAARQGRLDARFALRDQLTRKEWEKIYGKSK